MKLFKKVSLFPNESVNACHRNQVEEILEGNVRSGMPEMEKLLLVSNIGTQKLSFKPKIQGCGWIRIHFFKDPEGFSQCGTRSGSRFTKLR